MYLFRSHNSGVCVIKYTNREEGKGISLDALGEFVLQSTKTTAYHNMNNKRHLLNDQTCVFDR